MQDFQLEQDLVISRALVEIYSKRELSAALAFRGGTALHKLHIHPPVRYSEDIDLVQVQAGAIGPTLTSLRGVLDSWLGEPQWKQNEGRVTLNYRFDSEDAPPLRLRLKVEINSREHFTVFGLKTIPFAVDSRWFKGSANAHSTSGKKGATCSTWQRHSKRRTSIQLASWKLSGAI